MKKKYFKNFLQILILLAFTALCIQGFFIIPDELVIHRETLKLNHWNKAHDNLKIAVVSDIHAGSPFIGIKKLEKIVGLINKEKPDLILLPGDFVECGVIGGKFIKPEQITSVLSKLKSKYGMIAVLGNHDCKYSKEKVTAALEKGKIRVLNNDSTKFIINKKTLYIAGITDIVTDFPDIDKALSKVEKDKSTIFLSHEPDVFPFVPHNVSLTISGHTHGGQVKLPFIGAVVVPSIYKKRFLQGHVHENNKDLFISTGIGTSILPIRFRVIPELIILTVKSK